MSNMTKDRINLWYSKS